MAFFLLARLPRHAMSLMGIAQKRKRHPAQGRRSESVFVSPGWGGLLQSWGTLPRVMLSWIMLSSGMLGARASVAVFHNATTETVRLVVAPQGGAPQALVLEPEDARPVSSNRGLAVRLSAGRPSPAIEVDSDCAYDVVRLAPGQPLSLRPIPLGPQQGSFSPAEGPLHRIELTDAATIAVKLYVDDDEMRRRPVWERTLRQRIADASEALRAMRASVCGWWRRARGIRMTGNRISIAVCENLSRRRHATEPKWRLVLRVSTRSIRDVFTWGARAVRSILIF